jgi:hypothetical protein
VSLEVVGTGSGTTISDGFVDIGPANSWHITMSSQDIQVKNTPTAWDTLYLNFYRLTSGVEIGAPGSASHHRAFGTALVPA